MKKKDLNIMKKIKFEWHEKKKKDLNGMNVFI